MSLRYQDVKREIKQSVIKMKAGSKIPSRNFLSRKYEVARNTVDKAIGELEKEGYLTSIKGSGTFVVGASVKRILNVGVILPSVLGDVYPQLIAGIEEYASSNDVNIILSTSDDQPEKQRNNVARMVDMHVDGCIIVPIINSEQSFDTFSMLRDKKIPFVFCNRSMDGFEAPFIGINNHHGAFVATMHLIDEGCKKLSYFSHRKYSTAYDRYCGFETALFCREKEVERGDIILEKCSEEVMKKKMKNILKQPKHPDGILCFDDTTATMLYMVMMELEMVPGKDIRVVGNNNSNKCKVLPVPLSSVSLESMEMGMEAMKLLLEIIDGTCIERPFHLIEPKLIVRKSSLGCEK